MRIAIAKLGIGLRNHDPIHVKRCGEARDPAPLVGISDAQRGARRADELQIDGARRERDRDVVAAAGARRVASVLPLCGSTMSSSTSLLRSMTTRLYSLVTIATCASGNEARTVAIAGVERTRSPIRSVRESRIFTRAARAPTRRSRHRSRALEPRAARRDEARGRAAIPASRCCNRLSERSLRSPA